MTGEEEGLTVSRDHALRSDGASRGPNLADLLARVEKAEAPPVDWRGPESRVASIPWRLLDAEIDQLSPTEGSCYCVGSCLEGNMAYAGACIAIPHYTASLDAALALCERVLPGSLPGFWQQPNRDRQPVWTAHIRLPLPGPDLPVSEARTPALALLAAMLKALIANSDPNTSDRQGIPGRGG